MNKTQRKFENTFASFLSQSHALSFWKGRVTLYAILQALGVGKDDEVILPGYTCVMDVNPIKYLGAKPVYVDIEPLTFNINPADLKQKITAATKLIIAQHTYGYVCDMDQIMDIGARHNITVIEDCCLCLGSEYKGKLAGTFGQAAYFSFQWNKPFTTGLGGMVSTDNDDLAQKLALLHQQTAKPSAKDICMLAAQLSAYRTFIYPRTTALAQSAFRYLTKKGIVIGSSGTSEFTPEMPEGFFKRMSGIQASAGLRQLNKIEQNIAHRRKMADLYDELLADKGWPVRQYDKDVQRPVMVRYPVRISQKQKALEEAAAAGIELGSWFECPLHPIETPLEAYDYQIGMCPEAEKAARQVVNLPLHPRTNDKTIRKSVDFITNYSYCNPLS